jgi:hypothetical protein
MTGHLRKYREWIFKTPEPKLMKVLLNYEDNRKKRKKQY